MKDLLHRPVRIKKRGSAPLFRVEEGFFLKNPWKINKDSRGLTILHRGEQSLSITAYRTKRLGRTSPWREKASSRPKHGETLSLGEKYLAYHGSDDRLIIKDLDSGALILEEEYLGTTLGIDATEKGIFHLRRWPRSLQPTGGNFSELQYFEIRKRSWSSLATFEKAVSLDSSGSQGLVLVTREKAGSPLLTIKTLRNDEWEAALPLSIQAKLNHNNWKNAIAPGKAPLSYFYLDRENNSLLSFDLGRQREEVFLKESDATSVRTDKDLLLLSSPGRVTLYNSESKEKLFSLGTNKDYKEATLSAGYLLLWNRSRPEYQEIHFSF